MRRLKKVGKIVVNKQERQTSSKFNSKYAEKLKQVNKQKRGKENAKGPVFKVRRLSRVIGRYSNIMQLKDCFHLYNKPNSLSIIARLFINTINAGYLVSLSNTELGQNSRARKTSGDWCHRASLHEPRLIFSPV